MTREEIIAAFAPLVGLSFSIARRGGAMRVFHFGDIVEHEVGSSGEMALHLQCPWRLDGPLGTITGSDDIWLHRDLRARPENWSYEDGESLQDQRLSGLLGSYDLRVIAIDATRQGEVTIRFNGDYVLRLFPACSRGESWRLFRPGNAQIGHVVFEAPEM